MFGNDSPDRSLQQPKATHESKQNTTSDHALIPPTISLPKGGGALRSIDEKLSVNAVNGTCSIAVPLPFSKSRSDIGLKLSLQYNSGSGNGPFGLGWSLDLPSIQRRTDKQLPLYQDATESDVFVFSGVEDLVPAYRQDQNGNWIPDSKDIGTTHVQRYRPRIDSRCARIEKISVAGEVGFYWKVTRRDNTVTVFGRTAAARVADPSDPARIFRWHPEWAYDDRGNCVQYFYKDEDLTNVPNTVDERNRYNDLTPISNKYLKRIRYGNLEPYAPTGNSPVDPPSPSPSASYCFEAVLDYGDHDDAAPAPEESQLWPSRFDPFSDCRPGFEIRTYRLCRRILFFHSFDELDFAPSPCLVRSIDLAYQNFKFDNAPYQAQEVDFVTAVRRKHYNRTGPTSYVAKSWPALDLTYQPLSWNKAVNEISPEDVVGVPGGITRGYQWLDYYGDGVPGILTEQANRLYFKRNLGSGAFARPAVIAEKPNVTGLEPARLEFQDLAADGTKQLVCLSDETRGYFELDDDNNWLPFRQFAQFVNIDLRDPNTKLLDLNGDGAPDILISEEFVFRWHPSLGRDGYDQGQFSSKPFDEEAGPAILFGDGTQTIVTADLNGDGLIDIVRIRNGEICYWPNLGYGKFGAKVSMRHAPILDLPDRFDPSLVQFADISGTGAADLIYLGRDGFLAWINLAGNAWREAQSIDSFPGTEVPNRVAAIDILGNGTASLVWSSELPANGSAPLRYVDLMGGKKPYIVTGFNNNFGTVVSIEYLSSTHYALLDLKDGRTWATKLPFPTMCVSRVETTDTVVGATFAKLYRYRHGYYDHVEREFRGFGMVEESDSESFDNFQAEGTNTISDKTVFQPPVRIRSWYHTGAYIRGAEILRQFTNDYYENTTSPEFTLPAEIVVANSATPDECREAARACKSMLLRQETYAGDEIPQASIPYVTSDRSCYVRMLQPRLSNRHAVFLSIESETISYHYERNPDDPRIVHTLNTVVDDFGFVVESANVAYGRRNPDLTLPADVRGRSRITYTVKAYTNNVITDSTYRLQAPCDAQTFELTGAAPKNGCFELDELKAVFDSASPIRFEDQPHSGALEKRPISRRRSLFAADSDPNNPLALGVLEPRGLPYENYHLAFTPTLLNALY